MRYDQKLTLIGKPVTLNGQPAVISGAKNEFATITTMDMKLKVEFSWPTVERIVQKDGRFKS